MKTVGGCWEKATGSSWQRRQAVCIGYLCLEKSVRAQAVSAGEPRLLFLLLSTSILPLPYLFFLLLVCDPKLHFLSLLSNMLAHYSSLTQAVLLLLSCSSLVLGAHVQRRASVCNGHAEVCPVIPLNATLGRPLIHQLPYHLSYVIENTGMLLYAALLSRTSEILILSTVVIVRWST